jgi:adenosine kinase
VTGSIATDHLMTFPGRFTDSLVADRLDKVSLSFLVEDLDIRWGGVAANICFGMGVLGLHPTLLGAVGQDFADYRSWLERHGVDTSSVHVSELRHTARFLCTTDADHNQIASFYTGAMSEARAIEITPVADRLGGLDLVLIGPDDPEAMVRHTDECRSQQIPFAADPSQQLARMDGEQIRELIDGAKYLFSNEYESGLMVQKTGWSHAEILSRVGVRVTTHGGDGVVIENSGGILAKIPAVPTPGLVDPTGGGDAFRAGYLTGRAAGLDHEAAAQIGCTLATTVLETVGTQEYSLDQAVFLERLASAYGADASATAASTLKLG